MTIRRFPTSGPIALLLTSALSACGGDAPSAAPLARDLPHIVIVLADDLGYGDPHCYDEHSKIPTPYIDSLASEGMLFTDAHSPSAVCSPTRYGLLTGRYCWRTRMQREITSHWDPLLIDAETLTLPQMLQQSGYATACIGKWHLGIGAQQPGDYTEQDREKRPHRTDYTKPLTHGPNSCGFDYFFGATGKPGLFVHDDKASADEVLASWFIENETLLVGDPEEWRHTQVGPLLTERAVRWIRETHAAEPERPLFLYFAPTAVHEPLYPARFARGLSQAGKYGDYVAELDWTLGQLQGALEEAGIADNTLLIFTSDNGSARGNQKLIELFDHRANGPLRGWKRDIYEGGHRIPFIASWPGHIAPGTRSSELLSLTDMMATIANVVGAELGPLDAVDSFDMGPELLGNAHAGPLREETILHSSAGVFALRQGRWKWIDDPGAGSQVQTDPATDEGPGQLFDLQADPGEDHNLVDQEVDVVARLKARLKAVREGDRTR